MTSGPRGNGARPSPLAPSCLVAALACAAAAAAGPEAGDGCPVRVAILDTGIDVWHPQFQRSQLVGWKDFVFGFANPYDDNGHGTATASLVGGATLGTAPGVPLLVAKVLDGGGSGEFVWITEALRWAADMGADVVSLSVGSPLPTPGVWSDVDEAIAEVRARGVLVVAAAGNQFVVPSELEAMGYSPDALVVGAAYRDGRPAEFSNPDPEVLAWGVDVTTAYLSGGYRTWSGTSFATPQVAGYAATAYAALCQRLPDRVENALKATARDTWLPYASEGHGFVEPVSAQVAASRALDPNLAPEFTNQVANMASDWLRGAWTLG